MDTPVIDCGPCRLRPWSYDDAPHLVPLADDADVSRGLMDRFPHPYRTQDAEVYLAHAVTKPRELFAIEVDGALAGGIGVHPGEDVYRHSAEFGYWLGRSYWNRGLMTAVVRAFAVYAFPTFALYRLAARVYSSNPASARVLAKAGFDFEGVQRCAVVKRGELLDLHVYAKVRHSLEGTA